jgi:hypothetical protein
LEARDEKEQRFTNLVHSIIRRGGHVLLPAFALGRAQELLLILDEYWKKHPDLHSVPIYYASSLARKCMAVYQTYIHTMNSNIRSRFAKRDNPFVFKSDSNSTCFRRYAKSHFIDISQIYLNREAGRRKLQKALLVLFLLVPGSCKQVQAESYLNFGPRIPEMASLSLVTRLKEHWPG